jgi:hypothetical protein
MNRLHVGVILAVFLIVLAACDAPPCPDDKSAARAAANYRECILAFQRGDGGTVCGRKAYKTFCAARDQ